MTVTTNDIFAFTLVKRPQTHWWDEKEETIDSPRVRAVLDYILANYVTIEGELTEDERIDLYYSLIVTGKVKHRVGIWTEPKFYGETSYYIGTTYEYWTINPLLTFDSHDIRHNAYLNRGLFEYVRLNAPLGYHGGRQGILDTVTAYVSEGK